MFSIFQTLDYLDCLAQTPQVKKIKIWLNHAFLLPIIYGYVIKA